MKSHLIILLLLIFGSSGLLAQKGKLDLSIGADFGYYKDLNFSPLNYRLIGQSFSTKYAKQAAEEKSIFSAGLDLTYNRLNSKASQAFNTAYIIADLHLSYLRNLNISSEKIALYAGGEYKTNINYIDYGGKEAFSFLFAHSLAVKALAQYKINDRHSIQSSFSLPLVSLVARPPYNGHDKELQKYSTSMFKLITKNGKLGSLNQMIAFDWEIMYSYNLSKKIDLNAVYSLKYQSTYGINKSINLRNKINFGLSIKF